MMQQQRIILPTIKRLNKTLINTCAKLICISLLFITQTAHADFRKALTAYQNRDGKSMLAEVQDAVDEKNDDGLILFIGALQLDQILSTPTYSNLPEQQQLSNKQGILEGSMLNKIIGEKEQTSLFERLAKASKRSSFETEYEYLLLRYGVCITCRVNLPITADGKVDLLHPISKNQEHNRLTLIAEMKKLAYKGYGKAAYFLGSPLMPVNYPYLPKKWPKMAKKLGYQVEYREEANVNLPKISKTDKNSPVLSIHRYATYNFYADTNYFLDIYENGDVNFSRGVLADIPKSRQRIIKRLNGTEVKQLVNDLIAAGFYDQPPSSTSDYAKEPYQGRGGSSVGAEASIRSYVVTLRENNQIHTLIYRVFHGDRTTNSPPYLIQALKRIEKTVPTQFYRCGIASEHTYYSQYCTERDL
jgi:hypothetical protein